jgi:uncharacterized Zn finger protein
MRSVVDLVEENTIRELTTAAEFKTGQHIADNGGVDFTELTPLKVSAFVTSASDPPCSTLLESAPAGLKWHCTCSSNNALFCKHLVATALETWRKSPGGHA